MVCGACGGGASPQAPVALVSILKRNARTSLPMHAAPFMGGCCHGPLRASGTPDHFVAVSEVVKSGCLGEWLHP